MLRLALAAISLASLTACQPGEPGVAPLSDEDIAALRDLQAAYNAGVLAWDADARVAVFAEDAVYLAPGAPAIEGRAAILAALDVPVPPDEGLIDFTNTSLETYGQGDLAFDRGTLTYVGESMGDTVTMNGKYVLIARRQADGSWRWTAAIWNFDGPWPEPE